jgi:hypothetical protein
MSKLLVVVAAMFGVVMAIKMFAPAAWVAGFTIPIGSGIQFPWALVILGGFFYLVWTK